MSFYVASKSLSYENVDEFFFVLVLCHYWYEDVSKDCRYDLGSSQRTHWHEQSRKASMDHTFFSATQNLWCHCRMRWFLQGSTFYQWTETPGHFLFVVVVFIQNKGQSVEAQLINYEINGFDVTQSHQSTRLYCVLRRRHCFSYSIRRLLPNHCYILCLFARKSKEFLIQKSFQRNVNIL